MHERCQLRLSEKWKRTRQLQVKCDLKIVNRLVRNSKNQLKELQSRLIVMRDQLDMVKNSSEARSRHLSVHSQDIYIRELALDIPC